VISLAISPDGALVAAASISGSTALIDRKARSLARTLVGPGFRSGRSHFCRIAAPCSPAAPKHHPALERGNGEPADPMLLETAGDPLAAYAGGPRRRGLPRLRRLPHAWRRSD